MPQLNILQHKSYHPYLEKNKQRVRDDEAKAAAEAAAAEQSRLDADNAARLRALRRQAGSASPDRARGGRHGAAAEAVEAVEDGDLENLPSTSSSRRRDDAALKPGLIERRRLEKAREEKREKKRKDRLDFDWPSETAARQKQRDLRLKDAGGASSSSSSSRYRQDDHDAQHELGEHGERERRVDMGRWEKDGHFNFFADLEEAEQKPKLSMAEIVRKREKEDPHTMYLYRPDRETKPWYTDRELKRVEEKELGDEAEEKRARDRRKDARSKNRHDPLTSINTLLSSHSSPHASRPPPGPARAAHGGMSERERALAMIAKEKGSLAGFGRAWDDTPSTVAGAGGRSWMENFERQKDRAGNRYYVETPVREPSRVGGRSWEV